MIGRIQGNLLYKRPPYLLIDVGGIGYELQVSMHSFYTLPEINAVVTLYTHLINRDDGSNLYGFHNEYERDMFRALLKVSGVGPKSALNILSNITPAELSQYVIDSNLNVLMKLPGLGKKTAQRLLIEMRDVIANWNSAYDNNPTKEIPSCAAAQDALSALISLGYKKDAMQTMVLEYAKLYSKSSDIIRHILQELGKNIK